MSTVLELRSDGRNMLRIRMRPSGVATSWWYISRAKASACARYSSSVQSTSAEETESLPLSSPSLPSSSSSCVERRVVPPTAIPRSGSVIVVPLLEAKELLAGAVAKLLSALGKVVSGSIVLSMISHASAGVGLLLRSPRPFTGEPARQERLNGCIGRPSVVLLSGRNRLSPSGSEVSSGGVGRTLLEVLSAPWAGGSVPDALKVARSSGLASG